MADSPLEEMEAHERAHQAGEGRGDPLINQVTLTIAILAVAAAVVASLETTQGDKAIIAKNDAVLAQNRASDQWAFYEAKSFKKNLYTLAAQQGGPKAVDNAKVAARNASDEAGIQQKAKALEAERDKSSALAERLEVRHGWLTIASTLLHMSIAIATLSIILDRRWPWWTSIALAVGGAGMAAFAYLLG
jgi:hypothetical protein